MTKIKKPAVLLILDGFGISPKKKGNAVYYAKTPNLESISNKYQGTLLKASGIEVGLSWGEMGSSEVGHTNLGAGLVIYQNLSRINLSIQDRSFFNLSAWKNVIHHVASNNSDIHLMGLISNGGVHSHMDHLFAIIEAIKQLNFPVQDGPASSWKGNIFVHFFADGRDTAPQVALKFLEIVNKKIKKIKNIKIATIIGRHYAMDRNENWDRTRVVYDCLTGGIGNKTDNLEQAIANSYAKKISDEFIGPAVVCDKGGVPIGLVKNGDAVIFFNFRADRARQLTQAFVLPEFKYFERKRISDLFFVTMTDYGIEYPVEIAFPPQHVFMPLAKIISEAGKTQFHIAETEKYAHVTYFFNGGVEEPFLGEDRILIPSKSIESYDLKPEMSVYEITERAISELKKQRYDFMVINFANGDMVGHTGNFKASIKAVEAMDKCIGALAKTVLNLNGVLMITGDHGNVEEMINLSTNEMNKEHSINPVPFWMVGKDYKKTNAPQQAIGIEPRGILADVTPTILDIMEIPKPKEMTGASLLGIVSDCSLFK